MKYNMYKWADDLKKVGYKKPMPVLSYPGIQLTGITVKEMVSDGYLQAKCMKAVADRFDSAVSMSNMDLSVEAEAFGAKVNYTDTEVPSITGVLLDSEEKINDLTIPAIGQGRTGEYIKAITLANTLINDRPILAGVIGPLSLTARLMDMTNMMIKCMLEPDTVHKLLEKVLEFLINYIMEFKNAGANGVIMAEPVAGLLSPEMCMEFSSTYVKTIIDAVETEEFLVVYHNCGNTVPLVDSIIKTGARFIHLGNVIDLKQVIDRYPDNILILGNVSPPEFFNGTEESVRNATLSVVNKLSEYPNWVASSGCDIPPMTPLSNIDVFFRTVKEYYENK
jgi:uroporphyrinogen decarboxylase